MKAIVVGFDGSLTAFGMGAITMEDTPRVLRTKCTCTKPETKSKHNYSADKDGVRVDAIAEDVIEMIDWALSFGLPVFIAIEAPAGSQHAAAAKALGLAYGISRTACVARKLVPITIQAHEVKVHVGGSKAASKEDVANGVKRITGWVSTAKTLPAKEGEADALGVAITALNHPVLATLNRQIEVSKG